MLVMSRMVVSLPAISRSTQEATTSASDMTCSSLAATMRPMRSSVGAAFRRWIWSPRYWRSSRPKAAALAGSVRSRTSVPVTASVHSRNR